MFATFINLRSLNMPGDTQYIHFSSTTTSWCSRRGLSSPSSPLAASLRGSLLKRVRLSASRAPSIDSLEVTKTAKSPLSRAVAQERGLHPAHRQHRHPLSDQDVYPLGGTNKSSGQELSLNGSQFGGCSTTYNTPANT